MKSRAYTKTKRLVVVVVVVLCVRVHNKSGRASRVGKFLKINWCTPVL